MEDNEENQSILTEIVEWFIKFASFGYVIRGSHKAFQIIYKIFFALSLILVPSFLLSILPALIFKADGMYVLRIIIAILSVILIIFEAINWRHLRIEDYIRDFLILMSTLRINKDKTRGFFWKSVGLIFAFIGISAFLFGGFYQLLLAIGKDSGLLRAFALIISVWIAYALLIHGKRNLDEKLREYRKALIDLSLGIAVVVFSVFSVLNSGNKATIEDYVDIILVYLWAFTLIPNFTADIGRLYDLLSQYYFEDISRRRVKEIANCYSYRYTLYKKYHGFREETGEIWGNIKFEFSDDGDRKQAIKKIALIVFSSLIALVTVIGVPYICDSWINPFLATLGTRSETWINGLPPEVAALLAKIGMFGFVVFLFIIHLLYIIKTYKRNHDKFAKEKWQLIINLLALTYMMYKLTRSFFFKGAA